MQSQSFTKRINTQLLCSSTSALLLVGTAMADDTEVFRTQINSGQKPNVVFVLDYSGSMLEPADSTGTLSRGEVLKNSVRQILSESKDIINAGVGSLYSSRPTGVQWPVSDLTADANTIDPAIPAGTQTVEDVISNLLDTQPNYGMTVTVDALGVAASYFRGDEVFHNGKQANYTEYHEPNSFDVATSMYTGGGKAAANPATYTPVDAYKPTGGSGGFGYCKNFDLDGSGTNNNECVGLDTYDCETILAGNIVPATSLDNSRTFDDDLLSCKYRRPDIWSGAKYVSPITSECQANAIVLVSDGIPTDTENTDRISGIIGAPVSTCRDHTDLFTYDNQTNWGVCGPEVAAQLANNPQIANIEGSTVSTYTVGFNTKVNGSTYLKRVAEAGNGEFFSATSPEELTSALSNIVSSLTKTSHSFSPLEIDVNRANFSHENRAFFSLFRPSSAKVWNGNLKGYFIGEDGLRDINNNPVTVTSDGVEVMRDDAQSFWSPTPDGDDIEVGGVSAQLNSNARNLYTYLGDSNIPKTGISLTISGNHDIDVSNTALQDSLLGNTGNRDALINWISTAPMGDPLHSQPVQVKYNDGTSVMYMMTNQGFLHAFDVSDPKTPNGNTTGGKELFAFMPTELLPNIAEQYSGLSGADRIYGLDGDLVRWHDDLNKDGIVNNSDSVMLIFGMRRGGKHYYAVDVTNPGSPRLMWRIDGGSSEFPDLGETWSRPSLITVRNNGVETDVLAFGGGYDATSLDKTQQRKPNNQGSAIYMVDRYGKKVLSIDDKNVKGMQYAIPSDLTVIDTNGDDVTDRIYVGDLGGNLWRIDFDDISSGVSGTKLADLNDGGHRQFFYPPSVALNNSVNGDFLSISIGSGNRTNPLKENSNDRIYMLKDESINTSLPSTFKTITTSNLYNATENDIGSPDSTIADNARDKLNNSNGWYIDLSADEKSITPLVTFEGKLLATTFNPDANSLTDHCSVGTSNYFYQMDVATAQPVPPSNLSAGTTTFTSADRSRGLNGSGILPQPSVIFPEEGEVTIIVGNEKVTSFSQKLSRIFWHSK